MPSAYRKTQNAKRKTQNAKRKKSSLRVGVERHDRNGGSLVSDRRFLSALRRVFQNHIRVQQSRATTLPVVLRADFQPFDDVCLRLRCAVNLHFFQRNRMIDWLEAIC